MAASEKQQLWFWGTSVKDPPPLRTLLMAASQGVIMPGSPVELNASGLLELTDTADTSFTGFLCGVVDRSTTWPLTAALAASARVRVAVPRTTDLFGVYCDNNDTDSAVAQTAVGISYAIRVSAVSGMVGYTTMDLNVTNADFFNVVDLASNREPNQYTTSNNPGVAVVKIVATLLG